METKIIESPIARWLGTVTLKTDVNYADLIAWDDSTSDAEQHLGEPIADQPGYLQIKDVNRYRRARLPGILHFVSAHTLKGLPSQLTTENFPAVPRVSSARLFVWLRDEVSKIVLGDEDEEKKDVE